MKFFVISLKKNGFMIIFLLFTLSLLLFSSTNLIAAQDGLALWATSVLPTLFPFFIATELLCQTNFVNLLGKWLNPIMKPIFNVPGESAIAIILGTISGYPVGAKIVCNLKKQNIISKIEAERLIAYTNNSGPLFILGTVGISMFANKKIGILLLISHILASLCVGYVFHFWKKDHIKIDTSIFQTSSTALIKISDLGEIIGNAIKNAITTILTIGGFVVLFSVIISIFNHSGIMHIITTILSYWGISETISLPVITGLLEVTNGVSLSSALYTTMPTFSIFISAFLLGFGGLSVLLQVYSIIAKEGISIKPYFYGKFLQAIFSTVLIYLFI